MSQPTEGKHVSKRMDGCQSTHHTDCYGDLWPCAACGKTVCCAEGTDDHPDLCDACWTSRFTAKGGSDTQGVPITDDGTLLVACDCLESGGECGTWLELTPDGFLILEDKDGLRVSLLLPDWLDVAMRTTIQEHAAANEAAAKNQALSAVLGRLKDDVSF